jgi:hypothetical protein
MAVTEPETTTSNTVEQIPSVSDPKSGEPKEEPTEETIEKGITEEESNTNNDAKDEAVPEINGTPTAKANNNTLASEGPVVESPVKIDATEEDTRKRASPEPIPEDHPEAKKPKDETGDAKETHEDVEVMPAEPSSNDSDQQLVDDSNQETSANTQETADESTD